MKGDIIHSVSLARLNVLNKRWVELKIASWRANWAKRHQMGGNFTGNLPLWLQKHAADSRNGGPSPRVCLETSNNSTLRCVSTPWWIDSFIIIITCSWTNFQMTEGDLFFQHNLVLKKIARISGWSMSKFSRSV